MCIYAEACFKHITMKFLSFVTLKWYSHLFAFLNVFLKYLRATWWAFSFSFRGTLWILQVLEFKIKLLLSCSRNVVSWKSGISLRKHFDIYVFMVRVETASAVLRWGAFGSYVSLPFPFFFFFKHKHRALSTSGGLHLNRSSTTTSALNSKETSAPPEIHQALWSGQCSWQVGSVRNGLLTHPYQGW